MSNNLVPDLNTIAGRLVGGVLMLLMNHPVALFLLLAGLGGTSVAVLLDTVAKRP